MLDTTSVTPTQHALEMWRWRFPHADLKALPLAVRRAKPANPRLKQKFALWQRSRPIEARTRPASGTQLLHDEDADALFVVKFGWMNCVVITCYKLSEIRRTRLVA